MTRVAAVDAGTNSLRLLVADVTGGGLAEVHREMRVVRLGEGVDATGLLGAPALERARAALDDYAQTCRRLGVERTRMVATSATRDAGNPDDLRAVVRASLGVELDVVTGHEEAALSFAGATRALPGGDGPFLVVDIGGGSTELVLGSGAVEASCSVDLGCVRLTERHLRSDPPSAAELAAATAQVDEALDEAQRRVDVDRARTTIWVAGTATTVAAHALRLPSYDDAVLHGARLPSADVLRACEDLLGMSRSARRALPFMHPGRVDVIGGGALVMSRLLERLRVRTVVVSEADILDGIAWSVGNEGET